MQVGPARIQATGGQVVPVLLAMVVIGFTFYGVFITNQQTIQIQQEHAQHLSIISSEHRALSESLRELAVANENVFLSTILTPEQKKDLPQYVKDRAKAIVSRKAETITDTR